MRRFSGWGAGQPRVEPFVLLFAEVTFVKFLVAILNCPALGRSGPTDSPTQGTSEPPSPLLKIAKFPSPSSTNTTGTSSKQLKWAPCRATRPHLSPLHPSEVLGCRSTLRSMWWRGTGTTARSSTTWRTLQRSTLSALTTWFVAPQDCTCMQRL